MKDARLRLRAIDDDGDGADFAPDAPGQLDLFPADAESPAMDPLTERLSHRIVRGDP